MKDHSHLQIINIDFASIVFQQNFGLASDGIIEE